MEKIKYMVIGYGWRADFYIRAAQMLPDRLEAVSRVVRTSERAGELRKRGEAAFASIEEALKAGPDFAVLCVPREAAEEYLGQLARLQVPVLCETPPAADTEGLNQLWHMAERTKMKIQVAEQYIFWPVYAAIREIISRGIIGKTSMAMLSAVHDYHAVNLFRNFLGLGFENCRIHGESLKTSFVKTEDRGGFDYDGTVIDTKRALATLEFENGRTCIYDFMGEQYNSVIRTRRLNIQGTRGEINDLTVRYLNGHNEGMEENIRRVDRGICGNAGWHHLGMQFQGEYVYKNPFGDVRMNDDETAVAECLIKMKEYLDTGRESLSLRDALQDTYLSFAMETCISKGSTEMTRSQDWV
ncbi:Gfo/Idh/MocA family protein [Murimonas intestini]|uniref:Dehydrogenase n=1 Tax=Murimonas intestini TaxID=1337051 RepID=A0AB73SZI6_9FIRM|nr:Gfo/Idh/MocA family oxidoreductase [Murimonas intestini]MCR1842802.1 Gfo/Idh/MocA family oxidoreductase [Murimonas intestini]MCR1867859.1 Gfo/Idh/MocA family oxidoreductase [Murimonas intestini]MCR1885210.1 Gfo/Idh/MocA family oxidoreductase [Murimonas intestini]